MLGMGGTRFPPELYRTEEGRERCAELVAAAISRGINYFDTAPLYCEGHSETIFGLAFRHAKPAVPLYVTGKSTYSMDPTADDVLRRVEQSLSHLKVEKLAFYYMWCILDLEQFDRIMAPGGPYEGAIKAKEQGLIDHICFSAHCSGGDIAHIVRTGAYEGVTLGYNAMNHKYREEGLEAARQGNLGVAIMNPLGGGVIPKNPELFSFLRVRAEDTVATAAMRFVMDHRAVSTVLMGLSSESELSENLRCLEGESLTEDERGLMQVYLPALFDQLCTGCKYCSGCPGNIPTSRLMLSYNQFIFSGKNPKALRDDLINTWGIPPETEFACIACSECESKCTQHLPISQRIAEMNQAAFEYQREHTRVLRRLLSESDRIRTGVYACGPFAQRLIRLHEKISGDITGPLYFFDSDPRKWGKSFIREEWVIRPPEEIQSLGLRRIIITSEAHYRSIADSLEYLKTTGVELCGFGGN